MLKVVVGHSSEVDAADAIATVLQQCQAELGGLIPQAGILLSAVNFDYVLMLTQIQVTFPQLPLMGVTTDGEVSSKEGFQQDSVILILFSSDTVTLQMGAGHGASQDPLAAAQAAINQARSGQPEEPVLCLTLAESLHLNSVSIVDSLRLVLGEDFPIFGALAGDQAQFQQTYQFFQSEVLTDSILVLLFFGPLQYSYGMAHGWTPIAQRGMVTATGPNAIYAINDQPALDLYDYYLNGLTPSPEYPLAIFEKQTENFYLRAPVGCDRTRGSIQFLVDIPAHVEAQIAHASQSDILKACEIATNEALSRYAGNQPEAVLMFTCCTRRYLLGTRTQEECQISQQILPQDLPIVGFYSYGEIAPVAPGLPTRLHHETFVLLLLGC
jgi:hypothetical protein